MFSSPRRTRSGIWVQLSVGSPSVSKKIHGRNNLIPFLRRVFFLLRQQIKPFVDRSSKRRVSRGFESWHTKIVYCCKFLKHPHRAKRNNGKSQHASCSSESLKSSSLNVSIPLLSCSIDSPFIDSEVSNKRTQGHRGSGFSANSAAANGCCSS